MISIDFSNMMASAVTNGITEMEWSTTAALFRGAHGSVQQMRTSATIGFLDLPRDTALLRQSADFARRVRGMYDDIVLLGIGGSALGPIALRTALCKREWNTLSTDERDGFPRLIVLENIDPVTITATLDRLELARTLFIVTSKSGGTAETMSQFLITHDRVVTARLPVHEHFVFVTDPERGALRPLADALQIPALDIPPNVGGRYSVLTPVGTLPAALMGSDVEALLAGAGDMAARCDTAELSHNPAGVLGTLLYLADMQHGRVVDVFMPYADSLRDLAAWFVQLWAESLGKHRSDGTPTGSTPLSALGVTDQHSQVQLFMEGPPNKTVVFVVVKDHGVDLRIPAGFPDVTELAYLGGHSLGELLDVEQRATAGALAKHGRTNLTVHLDRVDAWHLGGLMMLLEVATAYAGQLYGVNAFDQPGVELGKQFAYALLGRPGSEAAQREWQTLPRPDARWQVGG